MSTQQYCLRWNNYQSNMTSVFHQLLQDGSFVDVTLACNDLSLKAHKVVLSACSSYFQKLLLENPCKHPTIIMPPDVCYADLKFIIEFVYKGEIDVSQAELQSILKTADQLKIKGLCDSSADDDKEISNNSSGEPPFHFIGGVTAAAAAAAGAGGGGGCCERRGFVRSRRTLASPKQFKADGRRHKIRKVEKESNDENDDQPHQQDEQKPEEQKESSKDADKDAKDKDKEQQEKRERERESESEHENNKQQQTTDDENDDDEHSFVEVDVEVDEEPKRKQQQHKDKDKDKEKAINMSLLAGQTIFSQFGVDNDDFPPEPPAPSATPVGHVDMHEHSPTRGLLHNTPIHRTDISDSHIKSYIEIKKEHDIKFETLRAFEQESLLEMDASRMSAGPDHSMDSHDDHEPGGLHTMMITPELMGMMPGTPNSRHHVFLDDLKSNGHSDHGHGRGHGGGPKTWTQEDMELALDALRNHNMSLTKASATYGIPSTTLWQRAHRLGIDTPKKEGPTKSWTEENLNSALEALRTGTISANKASKAYGIPSSTLYKIARREGIRLAAPFNAAPTTWSPEDLEKALESIRSGQTSVQRASTEYGIPTGTLYGRCKREGIELSRSNPTPWSEDAMTEALEAVRLGHMSINQAAIHYNLPYSSLYGRFKRGIKYDAEGMDINSDSQSQFDMQGIPMDYASMHASQFQPHPQHQSNS